MRQMKMRLMMRVLSLFDGMSCAQIALGRAGIDVEQYYSSEIDKFAIKVTQQNYPNTIQLGDVTSVRGVDLPQIDLLVAGSPCQGFSFAGKQLNFADSRSKLFFEFVRVLQECKPRWFILENVKMKKEYRDVISGFLGVEPIEINSALVSAQNRQRLYWTNIADLALPEDRGVVLSDILEDPHCVEEGYFKGGKLVEFFDRHAEAPVFSKSGLCHVGDADIKANESNKRVYHPSGKSPTLTTCGGGHREPKILCASIRGRMLVDGKRADGRGFPTAGKTKQYIEVRSDQKTNCLTTVQKDNVLVVDGVMGERVLKETRTWRKLTPLECERLQTVPDNYTASVSKTQRYKMLGNSFTVDVIAHILRGVDDE